MGCYVLLFLALLCGASLLVYVYQQYQGLYLPVVTGDSHQLCSELATYLDLLHIGGATSNESSLCRTASIPEGMAGDTGTSYDVIAAVDGSTLTAYQQKVHTALAEHVAANLRTLLGSRRKLQVRSTVSNYYGIQALARVRAASQQERDLSASDDALRHIWRQQKAADAHSCNAASRCEQYSMIFYFPGNSGDEPLHRRTLKDPVGADPESPLVSKGFVADAKTCFISLPLQATDQYDPADADAIYVANALGADCLRRLHGVPAGNAVAGDISDETVITSAEAAQYRVLGLVSTVQRTLQRLDSLVSLFGYREDLWAFVTMRWRHRRDIAAVLGRFHEMRQLIDNAKITDTNTAEQQRACVNKSSGDDPKVCTNAVDVVEALEALAYAAADTMTSLASDPAGGKREPAPLEQHFAVYGPYWLPLLVPVLRGLRIALTPSAS